MNIAALILVVIYISLCTIVVGAWAFKTIDEQDISLDKVNDDFPTENDDDLNEESGNLLG